MGNSVSIYSLMYFYVVCTRAQKEVVYNKEASSLDMPYMESNYISAAALNFFCRFICAQSNVIKDLFTLYLDCLLFGEKIIYEMNEHKKTVSINI